MQQLQSRLFDELRVGESASLTRLLNQNDIDVLAAASGDVNPGHLRRGGVAVTDDVRNTRGAGAEVLILAVLGTRLPGPGSEIVEQSLRFSGWLRVGDEITATVEVREKRAPSRVVFDCRCVNQRGEALASGTATVVVPAERIEVVREAPPELALRRHDAFLALFDRCADLPPVRCAVVHPCDAASLQGALEAGQRGLIDPVLVGPEKKIRDVAKECGIDLANVELVPVEHSHAAAERAVAMARAHQVDALMKGSLHTDELMAAVVPTPTGLRTDRRISHVFVMDVPSYPKLLLITDAAINIAPTLDEKRDIVQNAIDLARVLGIELPRVAILSAVETVNAAIPSTVDAAALCKMADRGQITGGLLEGPLAFDNAVSAAAAQAKHIVSPVAGDADVLVVPDIESGNMLAKQLSYLAGAESAGIVLGTRVPIVLTSRADSVRSRLASTAVLVLVAHAARAPRRPA